MRSDADWAEVIRVAEAICGRAVVNGSTAGFITHKLARLYIEKFRKPSEGFTLGHFGKIRGLNTWKNAAALVIAGQLRMKPEDLDAEAEAIFALDPEGRTPEVGAGVRRVVQGLRVAGQENGVPVEVTEPVCPLVRAVHNWRAMGEAVQAIGRGRGIRRTAGNPVLVLDINNVVPDQTYDAVMSWDAFAGFGETDAVLHARGVVPHWPADFLSLAPHVYFGRQDAKEVTRELLGRVDGTLNVKKRASPYILNTNIRANPLFDISLSSNSDAPQIPWFTTDTVLAGMPAEHPLLKPAKLQVAHYKPKRSRRTCWIDAERPAAADAALRRVAGCGLPTGQPVKRGHRPRSVDPSQAALRKREQRARKKVAAEAAAREALAAARAEPGSPGR
jgi:hypothetical protein